jgi:hypothetical protein
VPALRISLGFGFGFAKLALGFSYLRAPIRGRNTQSWGKLKPHAAFSENHDNGLPMPAARCPIGAAARRVAAGQPLRPPPGSQRSLPGADRALRQAVARRGPMIPSPQPKERPMGLASTVVSVATIYPAQPAAESVV